jgi:aerobic-type carbon monoxide dehydrogenase small subunit (CoxS/CutS family)
MSVIQFTLNGRPVTVNAEGDGLLLWTLRGELQLTGTKYGCGSGICGACTVLLDGQAARACVTSLARVQGRSVITIEGLAERGALHPLQQAFIDHGALQCGYCTPGMIMNAHALLLAKPHPTRRGPVSSSSCRIISTTGTPSAHWPWSPTGVATPRSSATTHRPAASR